MLWTHTKTEIGIYGVIFLFFGGNHHSPLSGTSAPTIFRASGTPVLDFGHTWFVMDCNLSLNGRTFMYWPQQWALNFSDWTGTG